MSITTNTKSISLFHLSFYLPLLDQYLFKAINYTFKNHKIGVVGKNGVGKTTLLRLILKDASPDEGSVDIQGTVSYYAQSYENIHNLLVSDVLDVREKLDALERINNGSCEPDDFDILNDDWLIKDNLIKLLSDLNLANLDLDRKFSTLSGGEKTRLFLAKAFLNEPDFIIFDEPTNNLDLSSKKLLYKKIQEYKKGLIIVSHDRELLNLMDEIVEITPMGFNSYGGNYSFYIKEKEALDKIKAKNFENAKKELTKVKQKLQKTKEKKEQKESHGKKSRQQGGQSKLILNAMQEKSEKTTGSLSTKEARLVDTANKELNIAQESFFIEKDFNFDMENTKVANNKKILEIKDLNFSYDKKNKIINDFNLLITGPERLAIYGNNGAGKTTLLKLITQELSADSGSILFGTNKINYLDQNISLLNDELSIIDNYLSINDNISEQDARNNLARFLFRNKLASKLVKDLSGGEKLRAGLAIILTSKTPPELLILDEPTNHLDLNSINFLERILNDYQGALLVISHDQFFLQHIKINKEILLREKD